MRVFRVRTEIRRQLRRRRTPWTFLILVLLPIVAVVAFEVGTEDSDEANRFVDLATSSAANFTVFMLIVSSSFLLVVVVSLFCGDTVAADASVGSLRYLLAVPVPRSRLLTVKLLVGLLYSLVAVLTLVVVSLVAGAVAFGWQPMQALTGDDVAAWQALPRILGMAGYIYVTLLVSAGVAFLLSVSTDAPLGAVGGAVLMGVLSSILDQITALGPVRMLLPTHYWDAFLGLFGSPVQVGDMVRGAVIALAYAVVFLVLAWWRFLRKDVTS